MGNREARPRRSNEPPPSPQPAPQEQQQQQQQQQMQLLTVAVDDEIMPAVSSEPTIIAQWTNHRAKQGTLLQHISDSDYKELRKKVWTCWLKNFLIFCGPFVVLSGGVEIGGRLKLIRLPPRYIRISGLLSVFVVTGCTIVGAPMTKCGEEVTLHLEKLKDKYAGQLGESC